MIHGKIRENFSIEVDVLLFQSGDEAGIGRSVQSRGRVNAHLPKGAEVSFFRAAVAVSVYAGFGHGNFRETDGIFPAPLVSFGGFSQGAPSFDVHHSSFDSWHKFKIKIGLRVRHELLHGSVHCFIKREIAFFIASRLAVVAGVKMILAVFAFYDFLVFGDAKSFRHRFLGLDLHRVKNISQTG